MTAAHALLAHADPAKRPGILHKLRHRARAKKAAARAIAGSPYSVLRNDAGRPWAIVEKSTNKSIAQPDWNDPHRMSVILAVLENWRSDANPQGSSGIDDLTAACNLPIMASSSSSLNPIMSITDKTLENVILYCPDSAIRKGVMCYGDCVLHNVLIIGAWQGIECGDGCNLRIEGNVSSIRNQTWSRSNPANSPIGQQGDQGGYGFYGIGDRLTIAPHSRLSCHCRSDGSDHQSTQYAFRTSGTQIVCEPGSIGIVLRGSSIKDFTSRMTDCEDNLIRMNTYGNTVSLGGGSAGPGVGSFSGTIYDSHFELTGGKVTIQPGGGPVEFVNCTSNKQPFHN